MISFKDVAEIEYIRHQIEKLQEELSAVRTLSFSTNGGPMDPEMREVLRDATARWMVAKIVLLLDKAARLGVSTDKERAMLAKYLNPSETQQLPSVNPP